MANRTNLRKLVLGGRGPRSGPQNPPDFTPIKWNKYFTSADTLKIDGNNFHYYLRGDQGPVLVTIHGGGYSALSWALFAAEMTEKVNCRILSMDLRGHGNTFTTNDEDLSLAQLANDVANVVNTLFQEEAAQIILLGHSLGGAVVVEAAPLVENLIGVCVIDVVEGTALESLASMQSILRGRPSTFNSIGHAIQWGFRGGSTHNLDAAKISMPGQIKCLKTGKIASQIVAETSDEELSTLNQVDVSNSRMKPQLMTSNSISEEAEEELETSTDISSISSELPPLPTCLQSSQSSIQSNLSKISTTSFKQPNKLEPKFGWRIDLTKTESFWSGWFKGLSDKFLNIPEPKILLLANIHGLDTRLTVGQMQGRFQMQVLPKTGHAIQEDQPGKVADVLSTFLVRQKLAEPAGGYVPSLPGC